MSAAALHHREIRVGHRIVDFFEPEGIFGVSEDQVVAFETSIRELFTRGRCDIRVGCRLMTRMDSSGVGVLIRTLTAARRRGGQLVVDARGHRQIDALFRMTGLNRVFYDDLDDGGMAGKHSPLIPPPDRGAASNAETPERDDPELQQ